MSRLLLALLAFSITFSTSAQDLTRKKYLHDSTYYEMYPHKWALRVYSSQKIQNFTILANTGDDIKYNVNTKLNLGVGITWHNYTLNVGYGLSALNKDDEKGKSKGLNLQLHTFPHKWAVDILAILPKGFHITPKGLGTGGTSNYYYRGDIQQKIYGVSAYRVPNKEKFSFRAFMNQFEWQKKSAGSLLYGGEAYYAATEGDSALVPKRLESNFDQKGIKEIRFITVGPGIGYAYTLVMAEHFFISGSIVGNLDLSFTKEESATSMEKKVTVGPSAVYKAGIGYNSAVWALAFNFSGNTFLRKGISSSDSYRFNQEAWKIFLSRKIETHHKHA